MNVPEMTLRDYFAAQAMAALMQVYWETDSEYTSGQDIILCQVESAYEYADAMIKQREKQTK
jgi:TfoX/Sxy family transcriptional regulator of competence genes